MKEVNRVDFGSVKIHKRVLAEIVINALSEVHGVQRLLKNFFVQAEELLGAKRYPGISVIVDKNNQVTVEVSILVEYGLNIPEAAKQVQDVIREAIERTVDIDLKDIHVNVQGLIKTVG